MSEAEENNEQPLELEENQVLNDTVYKAKAGVVYMSTVPPYMTPF